MHHEHLSICSIPCSRYLRNKCFRNDLPSSVHCVELYMMHVGLANAAYIAGHCRQLASQLHETAGDLLTSANLFST